MKMWKKFFMAFLAMTLLLAPSFGCMAAEGEYTVTISSGVQGTFKNGSDKLTYNVAAGSELAFAPNSEVVLNTAEDGTPSKYYVKGIRLSGRDDALVYTTFSKVIDDHQDYVVVYGIKGQQVEYTVKYVDKNGKELADSDIFYGNIGDKPVVACKYIEGYVPQALALEKTLDENAEENVFTFVYTASAISNTRKETVYVDGETTIIYIDRGTAVVGGTGGAEGGAGGGEDAEVPGGEDEPAEVVPTPEEIIDLDDEETPLGNIDLEEIQEELPMTGRVVLVVGSLAALLALIAFLVAKKRQENK